MRSIISHHFTVDVEEYFQVSALERHVDREGWDGFPTRVQLGVDCLLEFLKTKNATATFFVLGWIAERHPQMVSTIAQQGHEIASHGWGHRRVTRMSESEFRDSVTRSKTLLEEISGQPILGYRAPSYSIVPGGEWALDVLLEEGYRYDSSLFPVGRDGYGYPGGQRVPHWIERDSGRLLEVPPATVKLFGRTLPAAGGAYFRLLPYRLVRSGMIEAERLGSPATFYIHPWELDPEQPRLNVPLLTRIRHYGGIRSTRQRLERLLSEFRFTSIARGLGPKWLD
jgi:polysaccharide deacetylase family protein (PEP-CTERM system associated)